MPVFLLLMLCCCGALQSSASSLDSSITTIEFHFHDSAVPPLFNRSYDLYLTADTSSTIHVRSYGDYLLRRSFQLDSLAKLEWDTLTSNVYSSIEQGKKLTAGASGGRRFGLKLYAQATMVHELHWDSLQQLNDETENFIEAFHRLLPKQILKELKALNVNIY